MKGTKIQLTDQCASFKKKEAYKKKYYLVL